MTFRPTLQAKLHPVQKVSSRRTASLLNSDTSAQYSGSAGCLRVIKLDPIMGRKRLQNEDEELVVKLEAAQKSERKRKKRQPKPVAMGAG